MKSVCGQLEKKQNTHLAAISDNPPSLFHEFTGLPTFHWGGMLPLSCIAVLMIPQMEDGQQ